MSFPLLLLLPPDLKDLILPLHLLDKEEEDVFVVVVLIRGVLCNGDDRFPPPPTSYDNDREFVFRIVVQHLSLIIQRRWFCLQCRYYDYYDNGSG